MLNHIVIMGRLVRDVELRRTASGIAVASFTMAVDRDFTGKDSKEKETDFIDCVAWRGTGEFVSKYFTKGRMACVSGRLEKRKWTDKDGNKRETAEVVADNVYFADSKNAAADNNVGRTAAAPAGNPAAPASNPAAPAGYSVPPYANNNYAQLDDDEELPF